jgi:hypothetical protein
MPIARDGLKQIHTVALGVDERDILSHTRYLQWFSDYFTARVHNRSYQTTAINATGPLLILKKSPSALHNLSLLDQRITLPEMQFSASHTTREGLNFKT